MEEYEISINDFGCSDGDCYLKGIFRPRGQHTNGGCHCLRKLHPLEMIEVRKALLFRDNKIKEAEAENDRLRQALGIANSYIQTLKLEMSMDVVGIENLIAEALKDGE